MSSASIAFERAAPAPLRLDAPAGRWVVAAAVLGSGLASVDATVVNLALPALGRDLHADFAGLQWTINAYTLTLAALILLGGSLGDRYGRRKIFVLGTAYVGLCPHERTSGSSLRGRGHIGPLGPASLRKALYMPAIVAMRCNPPLRAFAERLRARGKRPKVVIIARASDYRGSGVPGPAPLLARAGRVDPDRAGRQGPHHPGPPVADRALRSPAAPAHHPAARRGAGGQAG